MIHRWATILLVVGMLGLLPVQAEAALVIEAQDAAIRTEGGPNPGGRWNLWTNGPVGQTVRISTTGWYLITIQAWGSPAGGVWTGNGSVDRWASS